MARSPLHEPSPELAERNRWTVRVLLGIALTLAVATLLVGIRW